MGRQGIPHGRRRIHEGPLSWNNASIWDVVLVDSSSRYHSSAGFYSQEVRWDGDIAKLYLMHHENASVRASFLEGFPFELGFHT